MTLCPAGPVPMDIIAYREPPDTEQHDIGVIGELKCD